MSTEPVYALGEALDAVQLRVLGALIEKEITTPEQYPLSLNALVNACNQRSSREPVMELSERDVRSALDALEGHELVRSMHDARVAKYEHRARTVLNLRRDETAILCLLLLRGPQTPGELRARADRLFGFDDLNAVQATLERLASRAPQAAETDARRTTPLVRSLGRQAGAREVRFGHLLGEHATAETPTAPAPTGQSRPERTDRVNPIDTVDTVDTIDRMNRMEAELAELRTQVAELSARLGRLES